MGVNTSLAKLRYAYKQNPVAFARDLLGIELTKQQKEIYLAMLKPDARVAVKSATGTGKTATIAVLILHQLLTEEEVNILATSPSAGQLARGLVKETNKMYNLIKEPIIKELFEIRKDRIFLKGLEPTHFVSFVTGSAENEESLAGFHSKKVLLLVDEASGITNRVMNILKGNLTTEGSGIVQISNPQRPSGPFYDLMTNPPSTYDVFTLDAFGTPLVSDKWIAEIEEEFGKESDFYRIRVLGQFPRSADDLFIPRDTVENAVKTSLQYKEYHNYPLVLGVDVARFGSDLTVFLLRQGQKIVDIKKFSGLDTMETVAELQQYYNLHKGISSIIMDEVGLGAGAFDRAKQLKLPVTGVNVGCRSTDSKAYYNLRAELYTELKEWLRAGADIPNDHELIDQLTALQYSFNNRSQLQLATKTYMKKLGLPSPDIADALSFTFLSTTGMAKRSNVRKRNVRRVRKWA